MSQDPFNPRYHLDSEQDHHLEPAKKGIDWLDLGKQLAIAVLIIAAAITLLVVAL